MGWMAPPCNSIGSKAQGRMRVATESDSAVTASTVARLRKAHIFEKAADGWYVEPEWCSARLFQVERFNGPIFDPACGGGNVLRSALAAGFEAVGTDVVDRPGRPEGTRFIQRDFLTGDPPVSPGAVVTNPPFDQFREFVERAIDVAPNVAILSLHRRLPAARWLQRLPLTAIYLLTPRPSMPPGEWIAAGNKPGGGTQDFCWLVFERTAPWMLWLDRDGGAR